MILYGNLKKPNPAERFFPVPKEIFMLELSPGELAVYFYLMYCEDRKTYKCYPSYTTIGRAVGMSKNSVRKHVAGLVDKRLITTEQTRIMTKDGRRHNGSLLYTILPIQQAVDFYYEQKLMDMRKQPR